MPTCNIYMKSNSYQADLQACFADLRKFVAKELSCGDISLTPEEISIRLIDTNTAAMIGKVEIEVFAYNFKERADQQDEFCRKLARVLEKILGLDLQEVQCWLILSELGHSWETLNNS